MKLATLVKEVVTDLLRIGGPRPMHRLWKQVCKDDRLEGNPGFNLFLDLLQEMQADGLVLVDYRLDEVGTVALADPAAPAPLVTPTAESLAFARVLEGNAVICPACEGSDYECPQCAGTGLVSKGDAEFLKGVASGRIVELNVPGYNAPAVSQVNPEAVRKQGVLNAIAALLNEDAAADARVRIAPPLVDTTALSVVCDACSGRAVWGTIAGRSPALACPVCDGTGLVPVDDAMARKAARDFELAEEAEEGGAL